MRDYRPEFISKARKDKELKDLLNTLCPNITDKYSFGYAYAVDEMLTMTYIALMNTFTCTVNAAADNDDLLFTKQILIEVNLHDLECLTFDVNEVPRLNFDF